MSEAKKYFFEVRSAQEVLEYMRFLPKDAIIFIDVDDTLITPISKTFHGTLSREMIDEIKEDKLKYPNYAEIISNWRLQRKAMILDQDWPKVIREFRKEFRVYALTKLDSGHFGNIESMEKWRYSELKSFGLEFTSDLQEENINGASFYKGIFMTGPNSKGKTLQNFLEYLSASMMVLVDDNVDYINDVASFCYDHSIDFIGILFRGLEQLKGRPDPRVVKIQREYLIKHAKWLEDDEAIKKIKKADISIDKNLFIIILKYHASLEKIDDCRPAHLEFLDRYYERGIFVVSGRQIPLTGGVIIAKNTIRLELENIMDQDPFMVENLATYDIYEFTPNKFSDSFKEILK